MRWVCGCVASDPVMRWVCGCVAADPGPGAEDAEGGPADHPPAGPGGREGGQAVQGQGRGGQVTSL